MSAPHNEETPRTGPRPPMEIVPPHEEPFLRNKLLLGLALVAALVLGVALVGLGMSQMRKGEQRTAAQEIAKQRAYDQRQAQQQAEQAQATRQASQEATISEAQLVSANIASLNAMRSELGLTITALNRKAKDSSSASRAWDKLWAERQASYRNRYAAVRAHNYRERQRYYAGRIETADSSGRLVVKYTYRPRYQRYPARPDKPAKLRVSVDSEIKRLALLRSQVDSLTSTAASQGPASRSFASVYQVMLTTAQALGATVRDTSKMARAVVVKRGDKGEIIDVAKIKKIQITALDAPFGELDQAFSAALSAVGLTPEQAAVSATSGP